jgi:preprotein translocase subunit SecE
VARDRQRAKQRKARREAAEQQHAVPESGLNREDVPGSVEHIGESDMVDAAIVEGAEGQVAEEGAVAGVDGVEHPEELSDEDFGELEDRLDEVEDSFEDGDSDRTAELEEELDEEIADRKRKRVAKPTAAQPTKGGIFTRTGAFLRASWAELQRVQWPDRRQVGQATAVVLGFVVVAGLYLGLADALAKKIVDAII